MIGALAQAIRILTILPVPCVRHEKTDFAAAAIFFPLVGTLVGLASAAVYAAFGGHLLSALIAVATSVVLTGALHEDGLADLFDGLFGGLTAEDRLRIMKDSRIGSFGALALIFSVAVRVFALSQCAMPKALLVLIASHSVGRLACVAALAVMPYAVEGSKLAESEAPVPSRNLIFAIMLGLWPLLLLPQIEAVAALTLAILAAGSVGWIAKRRIGGRTGDVLGAIEQAAEIGFWLGTAW